MALIFNNTANQSEFYRNRISLAEFNSPKLQESTSTFPVHHTEMTFRNWCFDGYRLAYSNLEQSDRVSYQVSNDLDAVKIYFNRKGSIEIAYRQLGKSFLVSGGEHNMIYSKELETSFEHTDHSSEIFSLQLTRDSFLDVVESYEIPRSFIEKISKHKPVLLSDHWLLTNIHIQRCIDDILHCEFINHLRQVYLKAKAMELFVLVMNTYYPNERNTSGFIKNRSDREKLIEVKIYLQQHCTSPITLKSLCKTFGINEYKLKGGFRELYQTSVIDYLIDQRLEHARTLLLDREKSVSDAAYESGYSSPQYFSRAFRKKFGVRPTDESRASKPM
ncbi:MAG: helix-turn-helix transcriptional regulator [Bacteroidota bacterium]